MAKERHREKERKRDRKAETLNHLSIHQWVRSAIFAPHQLTSPIGFPFLKLPPPPCAVLLVWTKKQAYMFSSTNKKNDLSETRPNGRCRGVVVQQRMIRTDLLNWYSLSWGGMFSRDTAGAAPFAYRGCIIQILRFDLTQCRSLGPTWVNKAPTSAQLGPTWLQLWPVAPTCPILVPSRTKLSSTWAQHRHARSNSQFPLFFRVSCM